MMHCLWKEWTSSRCLPELDIPMNDHRVCRSGTARISFVIPLYGVPATRDAVEILKLQPCWSPAYLFTIGSVILEGSS